MKTRIRILDDGAREIIRLISPGELEGYAKDDPLLYEKSIVWLEDAESLPFVRVKVVRTALSRRGHISFGNGARVVGYAKLTPNAPRCPETSGYVRRVFYLKADDPTDLESPVPTSAYDPRSILPGRKGTKLSTAQATSTVSQEVEID
jgi:hypothetical protein